MKKPSKFSWKTQLDSPLLNSSPMWACPSPQKAQDPFWVWIGMRHFAHRAGDPAPLSTLSFPVLSGLHLPRGAPGSARPSPQQLPGLRPRSPLLGAAHSRSRAPPCLWIDQSSGAGHGHPIRKGPRGSPAGPASGAAAPFGQRSRRGRAVACWLGSLREDPTPVPFRVWETQISGSSGGR